MRFSCPVCKKVYETHVGYAGYKFACTECNQRIQAPLPSPPVPPPLPIVRDDWDEGSTEDDYRPIRRERRREPEVIYVENRGLNRGLNFLGYAYGWYIIICLTLFVILPCAGCLVAVLANRFSGGMP